MRVVWGGGRCKVHELTLTVYFNYVRNAKCTVDTKSMNVSDLKLALSPLMIVQRTLLFCPLSPNFVKQKVQIRSSVERTLCGPGGPALTKRLLRLMDAGGERGGDMTAVRITI